MLPWGPILRFPRRLGVRSLTDIRSAFVPFEDFVSYRRYQAKKSVLIQVNSELSFPELHSYCSKFGDIVGAHHYSLQNQQHFMLLEYKTEHEISQLLSSACFSEEPEVIPVQSSCLWFRPPLSKNYKNQIIDKIIRPNSENVKLDAVNGCQIINDNILLDELIIADSVSMQMERLWYLTHLNDLGVRLRFLAAKQVESAFADLYPNIAVYPFGSSVNGFGKMGCDLDLVMKFTPQNPQANKESRLVFHTKKSIATGRLQQQRYVEIIGDMIQLFLPGCAHVRRISQARIPIIKYNQDHTGVECDLSMSSLSGLYMSEMLYLFGSLDSRVKPLVFTIRRWAKEIGLTNNNPGKWITNFPLTLMVIFFMQNAPDGPILPSLNYLKNCASKEDERITEDLINCTFMRDIKKLSFKTKNESSLELLLRQFYEFYGSFDFSSNAISINEGQIVNKRDYSSLHIINPLEINLNVSKNVSLEECERLIIECQNAAWSLENKKDESNDKEWGIVTLFKRQKLKYNLSKRLLSVKDLFNEETDAYEDLESDGDKLDTSKKVEKFRTENEIIIKQTDKVFNDINSNYEYSSRRRVWKR